MGGAYVLNNSGMMATIAFCFEDERRTGVFAHIVSALIAPGTSTEFRKVARALDGAAEAQSAAA